MIKYLFGFEKLLVWELAKKLTVEVYKITRSFPRSETFGLVSQMQRAAVSVASNIAEGVSRSSPKDQIRFMVFSYSSLMELLNQFHISADLGYIKKECLHEKRAEIQNISVKLLNLKKSLERKIQTFPTYNYPNATPDV